MKDSFGKNLETTVSLSDFPKLKSIYLGSDTFSILESLTIAHNPLLKSIEFDSLSYHPESDDDVGIDELVLSGISELDITIIRFTFINFNFFW